MSSNVNAFQFKCITWLYVIVTLSEYLSYLN